MNLTDSHVKIRSMPLTVTDYLILFSALAEPCAQKRLYNPGPNGPVLLRKRFISLNQENQHNNF
jgi:hypothetical protein